MTAQERHVLLSYKVRVAQNIGKGRHVGVAVVVAVIYIIKRKLVDAQLVRNLCALIKEEAGTFIIMVTGTP